MYSKHINMALAPKKKKKKKVRQKRGAQCGEGLEEIKVSRPGPHLHFPSPVFGRKSAESRLRDISPV